MPVAPTDASYVLLTGEPVLTAYRLLVAGNGLDLTDGGPLGNVALTVDESELDHALLGDLAANSHPQYILGSIYAANGDLLTRIAGAPAALNIGSAGQFLKVVGGLPAWSAPNKGSYILNSRNTLIDVANTVTETDIYNFSIPAGTAATGDLLELWLPGDLLVNSGANRTYQVKVYLGGTAYYDSTSGAFQVATRLVSHLQFRFSIRNASNDELMAGQQQQGTFNAAPAVGEGVIGSNPAQVGLAGFPVKDMASAQTLRVSVTWSGTGANVSWRCFSAHLIHHRPL